LTQRAEHGTIVDAALACGNAVCKLCNGHGFLDKTAKVLFAAVSKADDVRFSLGSIDLKTMIEKKKRKEFEYKTNSCDT
jgi:hypothetical protein